MFVLAVRFELVLPGVRSLKAKRSRVRPIVDGARHRYPVSIAEVDHQDRWQRCAIGAAVVSSSSSVAESVIDELERFVWSRPDIEIVSGQRWWLDVD